MLAAAWAGGSSDASGRPPAPLLVAAGDIACDPDSSLFNGGHGIGKSCRQLATSRLLRRADMVMALGDAQYEHGSYSNFQRSYDRSWGRYRRVTRAVAGNHEYGPPQNPNLGADGYWRYFGTSRAGAKDKGWYSFNLGNWHVIGLNSQCLTSRDPRYMQRKVGCDHGTEQVDWLKRDLADNDRKCILAAWHHPRFTSGSPWRELEPIWGVLDEAGADVVLSAHVHNYERFARQSADGSRTVEGIRQFVVGTGGKSISGQFLPRARHSQARRLAPGVLELRLGAAGYGWKFVQIGGRTLDRGSTSC